MRPIRRLCRATIVSLLSVAACVSTAGSEMVPVESPVDPAHRPWITVAPNGRYFMFEDGTPFFPLGVATSGDQLNLDYFGTVTLCRLGSEARCLQEETLTYDAEGLETVFVEMQAHGENLLRVDIEGPGWWTDADTQMLIDTGRVGFLEGPVGVFPQEYAMRIDRLVRLAEQYGIYLELVQIAHTCQLEGLDDQMPFWPYHVSEGGPATTLGDIITKSEARELWRQRLRYIVDRWGGSPSIFAWELWNELMGCGGSGAWQVDAGWVTEMGAFLRDYEKLRYGRAHLVTVSATGYIPDPAAPFLMNPSTDIATHHDYAGPSTSRRPMPVEVALHLRDMLSSLLEELVGYRRPVMENERLLHGSWPAALVSQSEHNVAWTYLASGAAGAGATWSSLGVLVPDTGRRPGFSKVRETHRVLRSIVERIDWTTFASRNYSQAVQSSNSAIVPTAASDGSTLLAWLLHNNPGDYEIDYIYALDDETDPPPFRDQLDALALWSQFLAEDAVPVDSASYVDQLAAIYTQYFGLDESAAQELARQTFLDPASVVRAYADYFLPLSPQEQALFLADVQDLIAAIMSDFESLEAQYHTLEKQYTDHPFVSTVLSFDGLCHGTHTIEWIDDDTGATIGIATVPGASFSAPTPPFRKHLALLLTSDCH